MIINKFQTSGGCTELFFAAESERNKDFKTEVEQVVFSVVSALPENASLVWMRFHVSDIANQYAVIMDVMNGINAVVAVTGQAPLSGAHIAVEAYALEGDCKVEFKSKNFCKVTFANYTQLFFNNSQLASSGSYDQMNEEFDYAEKIITEFGGTLEGNLHRTWIYCRDIDNNYAGLVKARRELFEARYPLYFQHRNRGTGRTVQPSGQNG